MSEILRRVAGQEIRIASGMGKGWDAYWQEPVICATCVHPLTMTKDTGVWKHKEPVPWCVRMRGQRPIRPVVHHGNGQRPSTEIGDIQ